MSFRWGRLPPVARVADWDRRASNGPVGSFRDADMRTMLPNGFKTYKLQHEDELTAVQREQIVPMDVKKTGTSTRPLYIEDRPLHMEVTNAEKIVTKYDSEIIELERATKTLADELHEMEIKEAEVARTNVPDVEKEQKEEDRKDYKVENDDSRKKKRMRKEKTVDKNESEKDKEDNVQQRSDADCTQSGVDIINDNQTDVKVKFSEEAGTCSEADTVDAELDVSASKLVADTIKAAVDALKVDIQAKLIVANVVNSAVKMITAHAKIIGDNAIKGAVNAIKLEQAKDEMDAKAKENSDYAIREAVNDMKDEKETNEMDLTVNRIVDAVSKGAVKTMKNEMDARAKTTVDVATKGAVNVMKNEQENNEMNSNTKEITNVAIKGDAKVMEAEHAKNELDADVAIKNAVQVTKAEKEKREMDARVKEIVDVATKGSVKAIMSKMQNTEMDLRADEIIHTAINGAMKAMTATKENNEMDASAKEIIGNAIQYGMNGINAKYTNFHMSIRAKEIVGAAIKGAVKAMRANKEVCKINKLQLKIGVATTVNDWAREIDGEVDNGSVLSAMLGQNGYDHRRIHVHVAPEMFTEKEIRDICQYWSEKLGIAMMKNTKLHRDVTYFGRI